MRIRPLFPSRTAPDGPDGPEPEGAGELPDYSRYGEEQLLQERERRQKQLDELTLHPERSPATWSLLASIDAEIERITDELIRRARSRHPSSRGLDQ